LINTFRVLVEVSEIDYFLYKTTAQVLTEKIDDTHVSDHHPIKFKFIRTLKRKKVLHAPRLQHLSKINDNHLFFL
jgi:hypothetical protein